MEGQNTVAPIFKWIPDEDDPKSNNKIVLTHVAFKGAQAGSILSTFIQLIIFRRRIRSTPFFRGNLYSTIGTSLGSVGAGYIILKKSDPVKNYDRAFRIQHNSLQNRCDKYSVMFSGVALLSTLWLFPIPSFVQLQVIEKALGIGCFGFGGGAICHYITKNGPGNIDPIALWRN